MRSFLSRFLAVAVVATAVDVGVYALLRGSDFAIAPANLIALVAAAVVSYGLHRSVTLRDSPFVRWLHQPPVFIGLAVFAGAIDMVLVFAFGGSVPAKVGAVVLTAIVRVVVHRSLLFREVRRDQGIPARREPPIGDIRLSVVIPAYGEADRIAGTIDALREGLREGLSDLDGDYELVVVDDGSTDATAAVARQAGADLVLEQPENRGKGAAVRVGMLAASGRVRVFLDADLAYGPPEILAIVEQVEAGWDVVVGDRRHVATRTLVQAGRLREIGGRFVNAATQMLLLGQYQDTQCGVKGFRGDVAVMIFAKARVDGFAFDIEVLHLVERYRLTLTEIPVSVTNSARSTVHIFRDTYRLLRDLLRVRFWARTGVYERSADDLPLPPSRG